VNNIRRDLEEEAEYDSDGMRFDRYILCMIRLLSLISLYVYIKLIFSWEGLTSFKTYPIES